MHPYQHAHAHPEKIALVIADTGRQLTYGELEARSNQAAHLFRARGLRAGDFIAAMLRNSLDYAIVYWAAQRSGLRIAPVSTHLKPEEAAYILNDCQARLLITSARIGETARIIAGERGLRAPTLDAVFDTGDAILEGTEGWQAALDAMPASRIADETSGYHLPYSGGTTGRPKGINVPFATGPIEAEGPIEMMTRERLQAFDPLVTFNAGPMYHMAPLFSLVMTHRMGGTAIFLEKFDPEQTLKAIEAWRCNYVQMVPTMFVRLLALPEEVRRRYDLSSIRHLIHAAAPCPVAIKQRMLGWLGPIIHESYSGSEAIGQTMIGPEEWLRKPGSVGRASWGTIHICDEQGTELPAGSSGLIYFAGVRPVEYRNDPERTARGRHPHHPEWSTLGDIGRLDEDGYLFLSDRKDFMIISGGVNIYPQAIEDILIAHPDVLDVAVIGVPNAEYGEEVKAIVQLRDPGKGSRAVESALIAWMRERVSGVSCPRSIDFVDELPRLPTGKLAKHELRRPYWPDPANVTSVPA